MRSLISCFIVLVLSLFFFACKKDKVEGSPDASELYGTWVKGANYGDTLWFMRKNGQDIMRMPESHNPLIPVYAEKEYRLDNGMLSIRSFSSSPHYFTISSFNWTDPKKEFTILNNQLFMYLSSMVTYKYKKI